MIGMSMLNTMILASTLVVTGTAFSILHSTLPVLSYKSRVNMVHTGGNRVLCYQLFVMLLLLMTNILDKGALSDSMRLESLFMQVQLSTDSHITLAKS